MAPEAENIITALLSDIQSPFETVRHERLTPLTYSGTISSLKQVCKGDSLITFSRKGVLNLAASLEKNGMKASVIYGALPPAARREEVRRFESGETSVVVATDAIGIGISLPIKRVVFCNTEKYDGVEFRDLKPEEIKQTAGRAGRFGIHKKGEVLTMQNENLVRSGLKKPCSPIKSLFIPFQKETRYSEFSLNILLRAWNELAREQESMLQGMEDAEILLDYLDHISDAVSKYLLYQMITCPVDTKSDKLVGYWIACCTNIAEGKDLLLPDFGDFSLEACETQYKSYDIRYQLLRRIGIEEPHLKESDMFDYYRWVESNASGCDACIMAAAVANLTLSHPYEGKFPSHNYKAGEKFSIEFEIAPRAIDVVKKVNPRCCLIGYKLFDAKTDEELIEIARHTQADAKANIIFANTPATAKGKKIAVMADNTALPCTFDEHLQLIKRAVMAEYFRTEIEPLTEEEKNNPDIREALATVKMFEKTFPDFGTATVPVGESPFLFATTSRGHKGEPVIVRNVDMENRIITATAKATLNAPTLWAVLNLKPHRIVVHRHTDDPLYKSEDSSILKFKEYLFPGTAEEAVKIRKYAACVCTIPTTSLFLRKMRSI